MKNCPNCHRQFSDDATTCEFDGTPLVGSASTQDPLIGTILNRRYKILDQIGRGSMSNVYLAEQLRVARKVAVKLLAEEFCRDEACIKRFQQEAKIVSSLDHPNLIRIFDFDHTDGGGLYIVTEYLRGQTLKAIIDRGAIEIPKAVRFAAQIADGLGAVHRAGIVHRDLNAKNVMVIDNETKITITDFGFARLREAESVARLTQVGTALGGPEYMAPEQIEGRETDERTDIYSLGILLYQMLCHTLPFTAPTPAAVWMQHLKAAPMPPTQLRPEISAELEQVILRALQKNPELRWQGMTEFAEAIRHTERVVGQKLSPSSEHPTSALDTRPRLTEISDSPVTHPAEALNRRTVHTDANFRTADAAPQTVIMESFDTSTVNSESDKSRYESVNSNNQTMVLTKALEIGPRPGRNWQVWSLGAAALFACAAIVWLGVFSKPVPENRPSSPAEDPSRTTVKELPPSQMVSISIDAEKAVLNLGEGTTLRLSVQYSDGSRKAISGTEPISWTSTDPTIAAVDSSGAVNAKKVGKAELKARYLGLETQLLPVQVKAPSPSPAAQPKLIAVTVKAAKRDLTVNDEVNLQATGIYSDKRQLAIKAGVRWDSSDPNIAAVTESGTVLAKKAGRVELIARYDGIASEPLTLLVKPASMKNPATIQQTRKPLATKVANTSEQIRNARSRLDRGEYTEALGELEKASKVDPGNKEVQAAILDAKRACNAERAFGRTDLKC